MVNTSYVTVCGGVSIPETQMPFIENHFFFHF